MYIPFLLLSSEDLDIIITHRSHKVSIITFSNFVSTCQRSNIDVPTVESLCPRRLHPIFMVWLSFSSWIKDHILIQCIFKEITCKMVGIFFVTDKIITNILYDP
jgi:hypothetical protein